MRPFFLACISAGLFGCTAMAAQETRLPDPAPTKAPEQSTGRLRPSPALVCDRNHLTSYSGLVSGYRIDAHSTWIEISTDEDTVEVVTVKHDGQADGRAHYLLWGAPFTAANIAQIEKSPGVLVERVRAIAWVCDDGKTAPVIDWQPVRANPG